MQVKFHTNLDNYKTNCFPENIAIPPRIGETVLVTQAFSDYYTRKKLPLRLEVVDVIWTEQGVLCELWYKKIDLEIAKQRNVNLL